MCHGPTILDVCLEAARAAGWPAVTLAVFVAVIFGRRGWLVRAWTLGSLVTGSVISAWVLPAHHDLGLELQLWLVLPLLLPMGLCLFLTGDGPR